MAVFGVKLFFSLLLIVVAISFVTCLEDETVIPTTDPSITTSQPKDSRIVGVRGKAVQQNPDVRTKRKKEKTGFAAGVTAVIFSGWKHFLLPFLVGVTLKVSTLVPVILMSMTILGGVALMVSKMALLMAALTAGHQYFTKEEKSSHHHIQQPDLFSAQAYPIPSLDQSGASDPYQQYAAASTNSASYPTGYSGSYSPYSQNQYYRRVIHNKR